MRVERRLLAILAGSCLLAVPALAEAVPSAATKAAVEEKGFTFTETMKAAAIPMGLSPMSTRRWATFSINTSR